MTVWSSSAREVSQRGSSVRLIRFFFVGCCIVSGAFAQVRDTGSIFGTITDTQGAAIPAVTVSITSAATGLNRTVTTDDSGGFLFPLLPVGTYNLSIEHSGFRKYERHGILIQTNENVRVDVGLTLGNVTETVSVEAQGAQVDTRSATLNHTVASRRVVALPLPGRNPADLVLLVPGVASAWPKGNHD